MKKTLLINLFIFILSGCLPETEVDENFFESLKDPYKDSILSISDTNSFSSTYTNKQLVNVELSNLTSSTKWCISEQQQEKPTLDLCEGGQGEDNGWHLDVPTSFLLSQEDGIKEIYLWPLMPDNEVRTEPLVTTITLDTTPPLLGISPFSNITSANLNSFSLSGNCSDTDKVTLHIAEQIFEVSCLNEQWNFLNNMNSFPEGSLDLHIEAQDKSGNISNRINTFIEKDSIIPIIAISNPTPGSFINSLNQDSFLISGSCSEDAIVRVSGSIEDTINCTSGTFSKNINFNAIDEGNIELSFNLNDQLGNSAVEKNISLQKDTIEPIVSITSPSDNSYINSTNLTNITISGTCSEYDQEVKLTGSVNSSVNCTSGNFQKNFDFSSYSDQTITISATQLDYAENNSLPSSKTYIKDTSPPIFTQNIYTQTNYIRANSVIFGGSCETGSQITVSGEENSTINCISQSWNFTTKEQTSDGIYSYSFLHSDNAGNSSSLNTNWKKDSTGPILDSFILASGSTEVALPAVQLTIDASDSYSSVVSYRISEISTFQDDSWQDYTTNTYYTLSSTNGQKEVYLWVRDSLGNISEPLSYSIYLDFGDPPDVSFLTPGSNMNYNTGENILISWSCSSNNGLDSTPITNIQYTIDDGQTFTTIEENLTNNLTTTTGDYNWSLPANLSSVPFKLKINCKSAAAVVSNSFSDYINTGGWSIFAGAPWYGLQNVNASIADFTASAGQSRTTIAVDKYNNIFYQKNHAIMKIDHLTGLVSLFAGNLNASGCSFSDGMPIRSAGSNLVTGPVIIGSNFSGDSIFILASSCGSVYKINTSTEELEVFASDSFSGFTEYYLTKRDELLIVKNNILSKLDLSSKGNSLTTIYGNGNCSLSVDNGALALSSPMVSGTNSDLVTPSCGGDYGIWTNDDSSKIWIAKWSGYINPNIIRLDYSESNSAYIIGTNNAGPEEHYSQDCKYSKFSSDIFCVSRHNGRIIKQFDTITESWVSPNITIPFSGNDNSGFLSVASGPTSLYSIYSKNSIDKIDMDENSSWEFTHIGGIPLTEMGNGDGRPSDIGLLNPNTIDYNNDTRTLWIGAQNHYRKVVFPNDLENDSYSISTLFDSIGSTVASINPEGSNIAYTYSFCSSYIYDFNISLEAQVSPRFLDPTGCYAGTETRHPIPSTTSVYKDATFNWNDIDSLVYHSNGNIYFPINGANGDNSVLIYSTDKTELTQVAGTIGTSTYSGDDIDALSAGFSRIDYMQEILTGVNQGDLLIWDSNKVRLLTITTESSSPRIYDILDLTMASGFVSGLTFVDVYYDESSEEQGLLGSGDIYYSTGSQIHKIEATVDNGSIINLTDNQYTFSNTSFSSPQITLTPLGLLILDKNNNRILKVEL